MRGFAAWALLACATLFAGTAAAQTTTNLVANFGQSSSINHNGIRAAVINTGGNDVGDGFTLTQVVVRLTSGTAYNSSRTYVKIYNDDSDDLGTLVANLISPSSASNGDNTFRAPTGTTLEENSTYWVVINHNVQARNFRLTQGHGEDSGKATGWSIDNDGRVLSGTNWSTSSHMPYIRVRGYANGVSGEPVITGAAQVGTTLEADTTGIADTDGLTTPNWTYQWERYDISGMTSEGNISGATSSTYDLTADDMGKRLKVTVGFTNDASVTSTRPSEIGNVVMPAAAACPTTDSTQVWCGTVTVGHDSLGADQGVGLLVSTAESFGSVAPPTFELEGTTYTVTAATAASNDFGFGTDDPLPAGGAGLTVHHQKIMGESALRLDGADGVNANGIWTFDDGTFTTSATPLNDVPLLHAGLRSHHIDTPTDIDTQVTLRLTRDANTDATGSVGVVGTARIGRTLTANVSAIADANGMALAEAGEADHTFTYQWLRFDSDGMSNEETIADATSSTYTLTSADEGKTVKVYVTFRDDAFYKEEFTSARFPAMGSVAATVGNATGAPAITGTPQVGATLTATLGDLADPQNLPTTTFPMGYTIQWTSEDADGSNSTDIGANDDEYTLTAAEEGKKIRVELTFMDGASNSEAVISEAYPADLDGVLPTAAACAVGNEWCGELTVGEVGNEFVGFTHGFNGGSFGALTNDVDIAVGSARHNVNGLERRHTGALQVTFATVSPYSRPAFGTVLEVQGKQFTLNESVVSGNNAFHIPSSGITWVEDQKVTASLNFPPRFESAIAEGTELTLDFHETLDASSEPAASAFSVSVDGTAAAPSSVMVSGSRAILTLASAVSTSNTVRVGYTVPSSNPLKDAQGLAAPAFSNRGVHVNTRNASGAPGVSGPPQVGETLEADIGTIADTDSLPGTFPDDYTFQWVREESDGSDPADITDATGSTYTVVDADLGKKIKVKVSFTDGANNAEGPLASAAYPSGSDVIVAARAACPTGSEWCAAITVAEGPEATPSEGTYGDLTGLEGDIDNRNLTYGNESYVVDALFVDYPDSEIHLQTTRGTEPTTFEGFPATSVLSLDSFTLPLTVSARASSAGPGDYDKLPLPGSFPQWIAEQKVTASLNFPPLLLDASVTGTLLKLTYHEDLKQPEFPGAPAFRVSVDGGAGVAPSTTSIRGGDSIWLTLATAVTSTQTVTVSYTVPGVDPLQDLSGIPAPGFTNLEVTNTRNVTDDATLSGLELKDTSDDSTITISPTFASNVTNYTASVANDVDEILIAPTTNDNGATVEYLNAADIGITDADDMAQGHQVALNEGANTIKVKVTSEDTMTVETYTVVVARTRGCPNGNEWCAEMTAGSFFSNPFTFYGFSGTGSDDYGALDDTDFVYGGQTFAVYDIRFEDAPVNDVASLLLDDYLPVGSKVNLGGTEYTADAGSRSTGNTGLHNWAASDPDWFGGRKVTVSVNLPPFLESATVDVDSDQLVLVYHETLKSGSVPAASAWSVVVDSATGVAPSSVAHDGKTITLTLAAAVTSGQIVKLTYTVPGSNPLQDAYDIEALAFTGRDVTVGAGSGNATGAPGISGSPQVGETLTAEIGTIADSDGLPDTFPNDYTFQWVREESDGSSPMDITDATGSTYTPVAADIGKKIKVEVSFNDDASVAEGPLSSAAYPDGSDTIVAARSACPTGNEWCTKLTAGRVSSPPNVITGYDVVRGLGALDDNSIDHGGTVVYSVNYASILSGESDQVNFGIDEFLPNGSILRFDDTEFVVTASTRQTLARVNSHNWDVPSGFAWIDRQTVTASVNLPPRLLSATVTGDSLTLGFHEALDTNSKPAASAFSITVDSGTPAAPTTVEISGSEVILTLASAVTSGQTVTVSYTAPGTNPLQDAEGIDAASFTDESATNVPATADTTVTQTAGGATWTLTGPAAVTAGGTYTYTITLASGTKSTNEYVGFYLPDSATNQDTLGTDPDNCASPKNFCAGFTGGGAQNGVWNDIQGHDTIYNVLSNTSPHSLTATLKVAATTPDDTEITFGAIENNGAPRAGGLTITVGGTSTTNTAATGAPTISGPHQVDGTLTVSMGDIMDDDGLPTTFPDDYNFQWAREDSDGANPGDISGATTQTYTPVGADVGKKIKVKVTFTDDGGTSETLASAAYPSDPDTVVAAKAACPDGNEWCAEMTAGSFFSNPFTFYGFSGTGSDDYGALDDTDFVYGGQTFAVYDIRFEDAPVNDVASLLLDDYLPVGSKVNLGGTEYTADAGSRSTGNTGLHNWAASDPDWFGGRKVTVSVNLPPFLESATVDIDSDQLVLVYHETLKSGSVPAASAWSVVVDSATGVAPSTVAHDGKTITLTLAAAVTSGQTVKLTYTVPGTNPLQDASDIEALAFTGRDVTVGAGSGNATGAPGISGSPQVDETLTAVIGTIADSDGLPDTFPDDYTFQWVREDADGSNPVDITGATGSTYTPVAADIGKKIKVEVSFDDDASVAEGPLSSAAYPGGTDTIVAARSACPTGNEWCTKLTAGSVSLPPNVITGYDVVRGLGALDDNTIDHGTAVYTVNYASVRSGESDRVNFGIDEFLPNGSILSFDDTEFVVTASTRETLARVNSHNWDTPAGFEWIDGQTVTASANLPPFLETATVNGDQLLLNYHETLKSTSVPAASAFSVSVAGVSAAPTNVALDGKTVTLTLASAVTSSQTVELTYTVPGSNPIQDAYDIEAPGFTDLAVAHAVNANLSALSLTNGSGNAIMLSPAFDSDTTSYHAAVANGVSSVTVLPTTSDSSATVAYTDGNGNAITDTDNGTAGLQFSPSVGTHTVEITVTASDSDSTRTYTVVLVRAGSAGVLIKNLSKGAHVSGSPTVGGTPNNSVAAQEFTTGNSAYVMTGAAISIGTVSNPFSLTPVARICPRGAGNYPDTNACLATLTAPNSFGTGRMDFDAPGVGVRLAAQTRYFLVMSLPASSQTFIINATQDNGEDAGGAAGWSIANVSRISVNGGAYTDGSSSTALRIGILGAAANPHTNTAATGAPTISGPPQVGETLTAGMGDIADTDGLPTTFPDDYTFQWAREDSDGSNPGDISGANSQTYTPVAADLDKKIKVKVTFTDDFRTEETLTSAAYPSGTDTIVAAKTACPTGNEWCETMTVGTGATTPQGTFYGYLTSNGSLSNQDITYEGTTYVVESIAINDFDSGTDTVTVTLDGFLPRGSVFNLGGTEFTANAASETSTVGDYSWNLPSGFTWTVGQTVTVSANLPPFLRRATFEDDEIELVYHETLKSSSVPAVSAFSVSVAGGSGVAPTNVELDDKTVTLTLATAITTGQTVALTYTVPGSNPLEDEQGIDAPALTDHSVTAKTLSGNATGAPTISGPPQVGETLTAGMGDIADADGLPTTFPDDYTFQWAREDSDGANPGDISGATARTYTPVAADLDKKIKVKVTFTDGGSTEETLTSAAYPAGSDTIVAAKAACPTGNEWCAEMTVESITAGTTTYFGYSSVSTPAYGSLDNAVIGYGGQNYTVEAVSTVFNGIAFNSVAFELDQILPDGAEFNFKGFSFGEESQRSITTGQHAWLADNVPSGFTPWIVGEKVTLSVNLPPFLQSATVNGDQLELVYHETLKSGSVPAASAFSVSVDGGSGVAPTNVVLDNKMVVLTLATAVTTGQTVELTYTVPGSNPLEDEAGIDAPGFSNQMVTNTTLPEQTREIGVLVSNFDQSIGVSGTPTQRATAFNTGANADGDGFTLTEVRLRFSTTSNNYNSSRTYAQIYNDNSGSIGTLFANLVSPSSVQFGNNNNTFTAPSGTTLAENTKYWLVVNDDVISGQRMPVRGTSANGEAAATLPGWTIDDDGFHFPSTNVWTSTNYSIAMNVRGYANSRPNTVATGAPDVSGAAQIDTELTSGISNIADSDGLTSPGWEYQWIRFDLDGSSNETPISGATSSTYTPVAADSGKRLKLEVSFTDDLGYTETVTSAITNVVMPAATACPTTTDDPTQIWCATLTVGVSSADERGYSGSSGYGGLSPDTFPLEGTTYTIPIFKTESFSNGLTYTTTPLFPVGGAGLTVHVQKYAGAIELPLSGAVQVQNVDLSVLIFTDAFDAPAATASLDDVSLLRNAVSGQLIETATDVDTEITVRLTREDNSDATGTVGVTGVARVGSVLTADTSTIDDANGTTLAEADEATHAFSYQWIRFDADGSSNETLISGATSKTYTLDADDDGKTIKVEVTFNDDAFYKEVVTSEIFPTTGTVTDPSGNATGTPAISGAPQVGETLTASLGTLDDPENLPTTTFPNGYTIQWSREDADGSNPVNIGTNDEQYTLVAADEGKKIRVELSFTDSGGGDESVSSEAYPADSDTIVAAKTACPTGNEWCAEMTAGSISAQATTYYGYSSETTPGYGSLDKTAIAYGGQNFLVEAVDAVFNGGVFSSVGFILDENLPNGAEFNFKGFSLGPEDQRSNGEYAWIAGNLPSGFTPWILGEKVTLSVNLPPFLQRATATGTSLVLEYHENLDTGSRPAASAYSIVVDGATSTPTAVDINDTDVTLTLASEVTPGDTVTVSYTLPANNPVQDLQGIDAPAFSSQSVTVRSVGDAPVFRDGADSPRGFRESIGFTVESTARTIGTPVSATDADGDTLTYSLSGADASLFTIESDSGQILTKVGEVYDHEGVLSDSEFDVTVTASDGFNETSVSLKLNVNDVSEPPLAPDAPTVTATSGSTTSLDVSWDAPVNSGRPDIIDYDLSYRESGARSWLDGPQDVTSLSATISGLTPGTEYEVRVRAVNDDGDGVNSDHAAASTSAPTLSFSQESYTAIEGLQDARVTLRLDPPHTSAVTILLTVEERGGASAADYSGVPTTVTFAAGETEQTFDVTAASDNEADEGESISITLGSPPSGVNVGNPSSATVALTADAGVEKWFIFFEDAEYEATEGGTAARITVGLSAPWKPERNEALTIGLFEPEHRGGADADDYSGLPESITFQPGQTRVSFVLRAEDDDFDDDGESVIVKFRQWTVNDLEAGKGPGRTTVRLIDNDGVVPVVASFDALAYTVAEGDSVDVTVRLDKAPGREVTIPISVEYGNDVDSSDFDGLPVSVLFGPNATERTFTLNAKNDRHNDDLEYLRLTLVDPPSRVSIGSQDTTTINIEDTDNGVPMATVGFSKSATEIKENGNITHITVLVEGDLSRDLTIPIVVAEYLNGATADDFTGVPTHVTAEAGGSGFVYIPIRVTNDSDVEPDEGIRLGFGDLPSGIEAREGAKTHKVTFLDDEGDPAVTVTGGGASEGRNAHISFAIELDYAPEFEVKIDYTTVDGSANAGQDFEARSGTLVFQPGQRWKGVRVNVCTDGIEEFPEEFKLQLSNPVRATLRDGGESATGYISNNNYAPFRPGPCTETGISVEDGEKNERPPSWYPEGTAWNMDFEVRLNQASDSRVTVDYRTFDRPGEAEAGEDYTATSGTVTFEPGETSKTVHVEILDDDEDEGRETLGLRLSNARGAYIGKDESVGTIRNSGLMPGAWLSRFGRAAADQAVQSIGERVREGSRPEQPNQLILGGRRVDNFFSRQRRTPQGGAARDGTGVELLIDPRLLTGEQIPGGSGFAPRIGKMKDSEQGTGLLNENPVKDSGVDSGLINESPINGGSTMDAGTAGGFDTFGGSAMGTGFEIGGGTATGGGMMGAGSMAASPMGADGMMNSGAMGAGSMGGSMDGSMGGSMGGSLNGPTGGGQLMRGGQPRPLITRQRGPIALPSGGSAGTGPGAMYDAGDRRLIPTMRDLMRGASFDYSRSVTEDNDARPGWLGDWSTWGRSAETRFSGAEDSLSVNGEVRTGTVGFDSRWNRWTGGLAVSHSEGFGGYTSPKNPGGTITSTLTTLLPYAGYTLSDHTNLWAALGYGAGNLSLTPGSRANTGDTHLTGTAGIGDTHFPGSGVYTGDTHLPGAELAANTRDTHHTGLTTKLAAFGGRGAFDARIAGIQLAWVSDAFLTETESETVQGLMGATGASSRARLMLEGTGTVNLLGGVLSPRVEAGLRYDGGDAETGAGFEVGGGLQYATGRLTVQLNARGLLAHQASAYEEWGYSGSVTFRPGEERRGLSMRLGTDWGAAQSGVQSMWSQAGASRMARGGMSANAAQRFQAELGYGLQRRYSEWFLEPFVTAESSQGNEALRYGLKLTSGERFEAGLEIGRRVMGTAHTEQAAQLSGQFRW